MEAARRGLLRAGGNPQQAIHSSWLKAPLVASVRASAGQHVPWFDTRSRSTISWMLFLQSVWRMRQVWSDLSVHLQTSDGHCGLRALNGGLFIISHLTANTQAIWCTCIKKEKYFHWNCPDTFLLTGVVCSFPWSLIELLFGLLFLSIYSTFISCTLVLMNLISIIGGILI